MKRKFRLLLWTIVVLLVLVGLPISLVQRQRRQERLDTALRVAVDKGEYAPVLESLRQGADPNTQLESEIRRHRDFWQSLMALFRPKQSSSSSALQRAFDERMVDIQSTGPASEITVGRHSPVQGSTPWDKIIEALLEHGADPNSPFGDNRSGVSLLRVAIGFQDDWMMRVLLKHGATVHLDDFVYVMREMQYGYHFDTLKLLCIHWNNINETDADGKTAIQIAISEYVSDEAHLMPFVRLLLAHKIDVHLPDRYGNTPLMMAQKYKLAKVAQALKEAGAIR